MKTHVKLLCIVCILFITTFLSAQTVHFNNGSFLVNQNDVFWVFDNGNFTLTSNNNTNPLVFENLKIKQNAVLTIGSQTNVTINDSLIKESGLSRLLLKSDAAGNASLITYGGIIGRATAEKFLPSSHLVGSTVSSPVKNAPQSLFAGAQGTFYYNPTSPGWASFTTGTLEVMRGYWTKFPIDHTLLLNDTLNTGEIEYTDIYRIAPYGQGNMGWNFLGNPYPSAIDWDEVIDINGGASAFTTTTKLNNAVYISNNNGLYKTFVSGVGTLGFNGVIPAYTAFWIHVNKDYHDPLNPFIPVAGAKLMLDNSVRLHENITGGSKNSIVNGIIRLFASTGQSTDEAVFRLTPDATLNFDPAFDAQKVFADEAVFPQIYLYPAYSDKMAINSIPDDIILPYSIPLGIKSKTNQLHNINIELLHFEFDHISVHLEDKLKNTLIDVRQQPDYSYISLIEEDAHRFILHLGLSNATNITDVINSEATIYSYENSVYVNNLSEQVTFSLFNVLGQEIYTKIITDSEAKIDFFLPNAYYFVRLTGNHTQNVKKVYIQSKHY